MTARLARSVKKYAPLHGCLRLSESGQSQGVFADKKGGNAQQKQEKDPCGEKQRVFYSCMP